VQIKFACELRIVTLLQRRRRRRLPRFDPMAVCIVIAACACAPESSRRDWLVQTMSKSPSSLLRAGTRLATSSDRARLRCRPLAQPSPMAGAMTAVAIIICLAAFGARASCLPGLRCLFFICSLLARNGIALR